MTQDSRINSESYWDSRFSDDWQAYEGPRQSRFFSRIALDNLPSWLIEQIRRDSLVFVDWGCAQGDGTDVWASYLNSRQLFGVDFSAVAIEQAQERYPAIRFVCGNWIEEKADNYDIYDVVFSSNTLEHFHNPYEVLETLGERAKKAVILALPYCELERIDEHFYSFLPGNIPIALKNGFRLVWSRVVDCSHFPNTLWGGEQIFLVYADTSWVDSLKLVLQDCEIRHDDTSTEIANLKQSVAERDGQIASLGQAIVDRSGQIVSLNQALADRDGQIVSLKQALADRDGQIVSLNQALADRDGQIVSLNQALADRDGQIASLGQTIVDLDGQIVRFNQEVAYGDEHIASLNQAMVDRDGENARLNQAVIDRDGQIANLYQVVKDRDGQIARLNQVMLKRDGQIVSLNQTVAGLKGQGAVLNARLLEISNWASRIDARPATYALRKTALSVARGSLRAMPVSIATKQRLRDIFFSTLRPLRASVRCKTAGVRAVEALPAVQMLPSFAGVPRDAFVFAVIDWHFRIQRPQHIARSLAEGGRRVFYFSNHFVDADEPGYQLERLPGADALYQIKLHVKGAPAIYFAPPTDDALAMLELSIARVIQDFGALSSMSVVQHAYWYPLVKRLPNSYRIYDCMDHHEGFGNVPEQLVAIEKEMLGGADLVTVTSSWLDDFARGYNANVALVRNAAEFPHFVTRPAQVYADAQGRRIIGYYGAIAEWFDLDLVRAVARAYPDCLVLLVGDDTVAAGKALADLSNVTFTGEVPYATLPFYLHAFDVCLLPFKVIPLTLATNPVKVYEYLAAGKPVVCVDLPEVGQFGDRVARSLSFDVFVADVGAALAESGPEAEQKAAERRRFASEQTWRHRGEELAAALAAVRMPRVSVIVLTFNNLELTRACLDSILERSDYPNLEVIVVDNASSDDTPSYLEDFARRHPDVRVVLNRENLGFAAGNNVGMSIATGDYLVILNNDTVVTQGWVMTLLRHFQAQPGLGLVGPVTNNIGNEARIEISYPDIAHMPGEALRYTLSHMGQRYLMRNAAFFCVMMPRSTYERCGPISEDYGRGFFEDDDYCRKVEAAGLMIACADDVFVHHHLSASFNKLKDAERRALFERNKAVYEHKWGTWVPHVYRN